MMPDTIMIPDTVVIPDTIEKPLKHNQGEKRGLFVQKILYQFQ